MESNCTIADLTDDKIDEICRIENESFSDPWSKESFISLLKQPYLKAYASFAGDLLTGYVLSAQIGDEAEIMNLAVAPEYRKLGIGRKLLDHAICSLDASDGVTVYLEVRESNTPARNLYRSRGFSETGIRKGYYIKPRENAVTMELKVK